MTKTRKHEMVSPAECGATHVGVRWWTAANDNNFGVRKLANLTLAGIALAQDIAEHDHLARRGSCGFNAAEVVALDSEGAPVATIQSDECWIDESSTGGTGIHRCAEWDDDLPVLDIGPVPHGEIRIEDIVGWEGPVWDGHNHIVFTCRRSRAFVADARREERDGHVTWVFDGTGDGAESLTDRVVDAGWEIIDEYATGRYGNDAGKFQIENSRNRWRITDALDEARIDWDFSEISDRASNQEAYACVLIAPLAEIDEARSACDRALRNL